MYTLGVDIGSTTSKAVILEDGENIVASSIVVATVGTAGVEEAVKNVKTSLVIEAIAKAEGVEVSEEEVNAEVEKMAAAYNMTVEQVK